MNRLFKGILIGSVIGITVSMLDVDNMSKMTKKCMKKGRRIIKNIM